MPGEIISPESIMPRILSTLLMLVAAIGLTGADVSEEKPFELSKDEKTLLDLTNNERAKEELPALTANPLLCKMARRHSANMAKQGKMEHKLDGKGPADRAKIVGYRYARIGENVAWSTGGTLKDIMKGWMKSEGHRANIMNEAFREIGLGIAEDENEESYYTQVFGRALKKK